ncbi:MAG TPA: hypothetical protein VF507_04670 [Pyrinomonadaceae bacterium]|jgi:predicted RNase H-like nuclease (RuvC/YqgF family)
MVILLILPSAKELGEVAGWLVFIVIVSGQTAWGLVERRRAQRAEREKEAAQQQLTHISQTPLSQVTPDDMTAYQLIRERQRLEGEVEKLRGELDESEKARESAERHANNLGQKLLRLDNLEERIRAIENESSRRIGGHKNPFPGGRR